MMHAAIVFLEESQLPLAYLYGAKQFQKQQHLHIERHYNLKFQDIINVLRTRAHVSPIE